MTTRPPGIVSSVVLALIVSVLPAAPPAAGQVPPLQGASRLAEIRSLYESADYERAIAVGARPAPAGLTTSEARDIEIYEALCLLALGRKAEADAKVEVVIRAEPLYQPPASLPNRLRVLVDDVRSRLRPALAQTHYLAGKRLFDTEQYEAAVEELGLVLRLTDVPADSSRDLADMRILATGFRDLAVRAIASPSPRVEAAPAPTGPSDGQVVPPVAIRQNLPPWPGTVDASRKQSQRTAPLGGILEVVVTRTGAVGSVKLIKRIDPHYDVLLLDAASQWKYQPATQNGVPVEYIKRLAVNIR